MICLRRLVEHHVCLTRVSHASSETYVRGSGRHEAYLTTITTAGALVMAKYEQSGDVW